MNPITTPRFTREELIEIVRRHVHAYKDDEQFAQAILDLAAFLAEYRAYKRVHLGPAETADSATGEMRRRWLRATEDRDEELKKVLLRYQQNRPANCNLCGAPSEGHAMCPNCGNMAI